MKKSESGLPVPEMGPLIIFFGLSFEFPARLDLGLFPARIEIDILNAGKRFQAKDHLGKQNLHLAYDERTV